ncbi:U-box domain-containing protein 8 [Glycine soja]|uniref:RING-type E3 ubiquitin transferase n=1 Tax=Glycine soja TaxID=3848 RepID=A0A0B2QGK3_GLYSO|nr:U-box domain-containing protein 8 [Glycine soja]
MSDPVILSSGHTFDRSSIQRWLDAGHRTCPITKLPLPEHSSLIPNHALRSLISNYAPINPLINSSNSHPQTLISTLTSPSSPLPSKLHALHHLTRLSHSDSLFRRRLFNSPALPGSINALVTLLRDGKGRERKEAATALYALCSFPDNRRKAVECGAVPVLFRCADSGLERSVEVIGVLSKSKEGREQMERFCGCVQILTRVFRNGSSRGVQYALMALYSLCCHSQETVVEALKNGVLEICQGLVEDDNVTVRRNSSCLVQLLRGNTHRLS